MAAYADAVHNGHDEKSNERVAVVTGAGGGVGGALVRTLADQGWRVLAVVRNQQDAQELNAIEGVEAHVLDLLRSEEVESWADELASHESSGIDLVVNAAAVAIVGSVGESSAADWDVILRTNVTAPALVSKGLLPAARTRHGTIVFINSGAGERAIPNHSLYVASKHALRGFANSLRIEEAPHGIRVSTVYPGQIATKMLRGIDERLGVEFRPEDYIDPQTVADTIVWIANATSDVHISNIDLRPRAEVSTTFNV